MREEGEKISLRDEMRMAECEERAVGVGVPLYKHETASKAVP